jgi:hypothetical protein
VVNIASPRLPACDTFVMITFPKKPTNFKAQTTGWHEDALQEATAELFHTFSLFFQWCN